MSLNLKEVSSQKDLKNFIAFQYDLYKNNKYFIPPLRFDELKSFVQTIAEAGATAVVIDRFNAMKGIPVDKFKAGIYFYTISVNNKSLITKKFIVKH